MAKNTGKGSDEGAVGGRSQLKTPAGWTKRDDETGRFMDVKSDDEPFKGVRREHPNAVHPGDALKANGAARKVSVSMPEDLTAAVQRRVGRGKFSQYVTEAVTRQLELDLLAELSELLTVEHGPVPEDYLAEAQDAWPDAR